MAQERKLDKRRRSIRNTRKITRTMELIATGRFRKAMDRAVSGAAYTKRITALVADLAHSGLEAVHPLLEPHATTERVSLLVLSANRGLCGGYIGNVLRLAYHRLQELQSEGLAVQTLVSGKRGISAFKFRKVPVAETFTQFEDKPKFAEIEELANRFIHQYLTGEIDRLEIAYTKFESASRQVATIETLLPMTEIEGFEREEAEPYGPSMYDFLPSPEDILEEIVPASFKVKLFKCFLDAAVSEQIARRVAMKAATENADTLISNLSIAYNRARQGRITSELLEVIGGAEALNK